MIFALLKGKDHITDWQTFAVFFIQVFKLIVTVAGGNHFLPEAMLSDKPSVVQSLTASE